jgi:hypothetical protein
MLMAAHMSRSGAARAGNMRKSLISVALAAVLNTTFLSSLGCFLQCSFCGQHQGSLTKSAFQPECKSCLPVNPRQGQHQDHSECPRQNHIVLGISTPLDSLQSAQQYKAYRISSSAPHSFAQSSLLALSYSLPPSPTLARLGDLGFGHRAVLRI